MHSATVRAQQHPEGDRCPLGVLLGAIKALLVHQLTPHFAQKTRCHLVWDRRPIRNFLGHRNSRAVVVWWSGGGFCIQSMTERDGERVNGDDAQEWWLATYNEGLDGIDQIPFDDVRLRRQDDDH